MQSFIFIGWWLHDLFQLQTVQRNWSAWRAEPPWPYSNSHHHTVPRVSYPKCSYTHTQPSKKDHNTTFTQFRICKPGFRLVVQVVVGCWGHSSSHFTCEVQFLTILWKKSAYLGFSYFDFHDSFYLISLTSTLILSAVLHHWSITKVHQLLVNKKK